MQPLPRRGATLTASTMARRKQSSTMESSESTVAARDETLAVAAEAEVGRALS